MHQKDSHERESLDWSSFRIALVNFTVGSYVGIESICIRCNCNFNFHSECFKLVMIFNFHSESFKLVMIFKPPIEVFLIKVFLIVIILLVFKFIFCCT